MGSIESLFQLQAADRPRKLELLKSHMKMPSHFTPKLELKPLPENLKYAYLHDDETLPVNI